MCLFVFLIAHNVHIRVYVRAIHTRVSTPACQLGRTSMAAGFSAGRYRW